MWAFFRRQYQVPKICFDDYLFELKSLEQDPDLFWFLFKSLPESLTDRSQSTTSKSNSDILSEWVDKFQKRTEEGFHFTYPGQDDYPLGFQVLEDPPLFISYQGDLRSCLKSNTLAVVGSRNPNPLSLQWMEVELSRFLSQPGPNWALVSGGARGIDQKAHALALQESKPTLVVVPSGLARIYPPNLSDWVDPIVKGGGCLLSEHFPLESVRKHFFCPRNRLIAALGVATLIVDARLRSGTMTTARHTMNLGKSVYVLPVHPQDPRSSGSLELLFEGATMVRNAEDLIMYLASDLQTQATFSV